MSGLYGWLCSRNDTLVDHALHADMAATLLSSAPLWSTGGPSNWGIGTRACQDSTARFSGPDTAAVISGHPRWIAQYDSPDHDTGQCAAALAAEYGRRGPEALHHLRGHFALALIEPSRCRALLATDRMGTHPLCYAVTADGCLVFGSTTDAVRAHPRVVTAPDYQSLYNYIYFHVIPSPRTVYREIRKLGPAEMLVFEDGRIRIQRYWTPSFTNNRPPSSAGRSHRLQDLLLQAVHRCDPSPETGAFLSGGLDSSSVCGMLAKLNGRDVRAFSVGFGAQGYDEMRYARVTAKHFSLDLHERYATPEDIAEALPLITTAYDEPFGNSSAVPTLLCARLAAANGVRVLLAGDGGDELFAGNERYAKQQLFQEYFSVPSWLRSTVLEPLFLGRTAALIYPTRKIGRYIEQARIPLPDRLQTYNLLHRDSPESVFESQFLDQIDVEEPINHLRDIYREPDAPSFLSRMLYLDWKLTLADNDLRKVSRMCAAAGIGVRYPMLDDDLVDFATHVPAELMLKWWRLRYFYRKQMKGFLPKEVIAKRKHGFGLPFGVWLKTSPRLQESIYSNLDNLKNRGIIRPAFVARLIEAHRTDHAAYYGTMVWVLAVLEGWLQAHRLTL